MQAEQHEVEIGQAVPIEIALDIGLGRGRVDLNAQLAKLKQAREGLS